MTRLERIKREIKERLRKYNIKHATLEFECKKCMKNDKISKLEH